MIFSNKKTCNYKALIVCLGNPGMQYEGTRHNVGFAAGEILAKKHNMEFNKHKYKSVLADGKIGDERVLVIKPETYMNLSGEAVSEVCKFYKIPSDRVIVLSDDVSLDVGKIRIRKKGSDGGHNGLKNIILMLNTDVFARVRIGVGKKPHPEYDLAAWVLGHFPSEQNEALCVALNNAVSAVEDIVGGNIDKAMNKYN